jgi:putative flavoprotein involved in K+ transport
MKTTAFENEVRADALIESGEAFRRLGGLDEASRRDRYDVIVIGGGQAGLSVGYHLGRQGLRFVILDAAERIGDAWRKRWDSLRLFTPAKLDGLDGMRFPAPPNYFPTKDEMADYLGSYAARFNLPVETGTRVERLTRTDGGFVVRTSKRELVADQVVVAMANYQAHRLPELSSRLRPDIVQIHSSAYRNPGQLRAGDVLIAGAGNSGAEIARELADGRRVWVAGPSTGEAPIRMDSFASRALLVRLLMRVVFHRILTVKTPMGRKARPKMMSRGTPLIRIKAKDLLAAGVERVPRVTGVQDGLPVLQDGRVLAPANIIWCTGYHGGFSWIDLPIFDGTGEPIHEAGVVSAAPGLYFVGLHFLYAMSSSMIHGVGRDAKRIARAVARGARAPRAGVAVEVRVAS